MTALYVDMDGTLVQYISDPVEDMKRDGFFRSLRPNENVVEGVRLFMNEHPDVEVHVLTAVFDGGEKYMREKTEWINEFCPFLSGKAIFIPVGSSKKSVTERGCTSFLLDDFSRNLEDFVSQKGNHGIKLLNGFNGKGAVWHGDRIRASLEPECFARALFEKMKPMIDADVS